MIAHLQGIIFSKHPGELLITISGVTFLVFISHNTYEKLPEAGQQASLYTLLIPREDSMQLFGFADLNEKKTFVALTSVSGVGPKSAIGILSGVSSETFWDYIATGNNLALEKLPGIGKKTAERLLVELKDKVPKDLSISSTSSAELNTDTSQESVLALISLGYNKAVAEKSVKAALKQLPNKSSVVEIIRLALKLAVS